MTIVHCIYKYMIRLNDIDIDSTYMYACHIRCVHLLYNHGISISLSLSLHGYPKGPAKIVMHAHTHTYIYIYTYLHIPYLCVRRITGVECSRRPVWRRPSLFSVQFGPPVAKTHRFMPSSCSFSKDASWGFPSWQSSPPSYLTINLQRFWALQIHGKESISYQS